MLLCCRLQYDGALLQRAEAASLPARREKAERIRSVQGRAASLAAGLLLRHGLFLCGLGEDQIRASPEGKPFLAGNPAFVSLSHSGDYAACAIAPVPVGWISSGSCRSARGQFGVSAPPGSLPG